VKSIISAKMYPLFAQLAADQFSKSLDWLQLETYDTESMHFMIT